MVYLQNFAAPYALWIPAVLLVGLAVVLGSRPLGPSALLGPSPAPGWLTGCGVRRPWSSSCSSPVWCRPLIGSGRAATSCTVGFAGPIVLSVGADRGDTAAVTAGWLVRAGGRPPACWRRRRALGCTGRLGALGGEFARDGRRRDPGDLLGNRRRAALLLPRPPATRTR